VALREAVRAGFLATGMGKVAIRCAQA